MKHVSTEELRQMIEGKKHFFLIDVRQKEELHYGMIPTAHHLPLHELEAALSMGATYFQATYNFPKPKKEDTIVFYCRSGGRSRIATSIAQANGYKNAGNYNSGTK